MKSFHHADFVNVLPMMLAESVLRLLEFVAYSMGNDSRSDCLAVDVHGGSAAIPAREIKTVNYFVLPHIVARIAALTHIIQSTASSTGRCFALNPADCKTRTIVITTAFGIPRLAKLVRAATTLEVTV